MTGGGVNVVEDVDEVENICAAVPLVINVLVLSSVAVELRLGDWQLLKSSQVGREVLGHAAMHS